MKNEYSYNVAETSTNEEMIWRVQEVRRFLRPR